MKSPPRGGLSEIQSDNSPHIAPGNPLNKLARCCSQHATLRRGTKQPSRNLSGHIARPTFLDIERHHAQRALILASDNVCDDRRLVGFAVGDLTPDATHRGRLTRNRQSAHWSA